MDGPSDSLRDVAKARSSSTEEAIMLLFAGSPIDSEFADSEHASLYCWREVLRRSLNWVR